MNKLSEEQVIEIRRLYDTGKYTYTDLKNMFNLKGVTTISNIINYISWQHIG